MWSDQDRKRYDRSGLRYPSDLTDVEGSLIEPHIPPAKRGGRKHSIEAREVLQGILYVLETGCQWRTRTLIVTTSTTKRSGDFIDLLEELDRRYGPQPGIEPKSVIIVLDNGPVHTSKATRKALDERAHRLNVEWLPKYTPELNDI